MYLHWAVGLTVGLCFLSMVWWMYCYWHPLSTGIELDAAERQRLDNPPDIDYEELRQ